MKKFLIPSIILICCLLVLAGCEYQDIDNETSENIVNNIVEEERAKVDNTKGNEVVKVENNNEVEVEKNTIPDNEIDSDKSNIIEEKTENTSNEKIVEVEEAKDDGSIIFGNYGGEPIEWLVLENSGDKKLIVTRYVIDYLPYNETMFAESTYWKDSSLRKWLNGDFINTAFTKEEQKKIITTNVQDYKEDKQLGDVTKDKVFLLSYAQVNLYFKNAATVYTKYAESKTSYVNNSWWLIDSYMSGLYKNCVNRNGLVENSPRVNEKEGIRPAMWIKN